jgi:hypothetical protein
MRCADCKYFDKEDGRPDVLAGSGRCTRWKEGYRNHVPPGWMQPNEAWVENDEGWGNVVGPEFGCVLFRDARA